MIDWDNLGKEKKLVLSSFVFLFFIVASMGIFMESNSVEMTQFGVGEQKFDGNSPITYNELENKESEDGMKAIVKGSIYEEGSNMTVYGACFKGNGQLEPDANATFTAWYPNGTIHTGPNASMDKITEDYSGTYPNGTGRWKIHVTMGSTIGTYLTEMRCNLGNQNAIAFGEWQNPEWVVRIGDTQASVNSTYNLLSNVSSDLTIFRNDTNNNFTDVLNNLNEINSSLSSGVSINDTELQRKIRELGDMVKSMDLNLWVLDDTNPFFVLSSGIHNFEAVDMLNDRSVTAVSSDGYFVQWDGETWTEEQLTGIEFRGVSSLAANAPYAWGVGTNGTDPVISIDGNNATVPTLPSGSPTAFNDVSIFQRPNDPSGQTYGYLLGDDGTVYFSENFGTNWTVAGTMDNASKGRFSQVVENYDNPQENGYLIMAGQGNQVFTHDGNNSQTYNVSGDVKDVTLLYSDLGYVVTEDTLTTKIYKFDGTGLTLDFEIEDSLIVPTGIHANTQTDIWLTTSDPSTFFSFDGQRWEYSEVGYSELVSITIGFGNATNVTGVNDLAMSDSRNGYAVGDNGLVLVYQQHYDSRFDQIESKINTTQAQINLTREDIEELKNITLAINVSLQQEITNIDNFLSSMNSTLNTKLDNILSNVTYTNLYLETTVFPTLNDTYQNTVTILQRLGVIEQTLNETRDIANQTLNISQNTSAGVNELVNNSRRIRAWITQ